MKAEPCLPPPREKPALSNYRNYSALLMDQIHPGRTTARKPSAPRAGCPTASDRPIRPLPTPSADTSCGSAGPGHQPPLPAADGQPAPRARLAEAALENAGDHREFRSRPYHAAAAVGLGKNGDKKAAIIRLHCRAAQSGNFAVPDRHPQATASEIAQAIGLQASRTRQYLAGLTAEGAIVAEGANKGRRYRLKA